MIERGFKPEVWPAKLCESLHWTELLMLLLIGVCGDALLGTILGRSDGDGRLLTTTEPLRRPPTEDRPIPDNQKKGIERKEQPKKKNVRQISEMCCANTNKQARNELERESGRKNEWKRNEGQNEKKMKGNQMKKRKPKNNLKMKQQLVSKQLVVEHPLVRNCSKWERQEIRNVKRREKRFRTDRERKEIVN